MTKDGIRQEIRERRRALDRGWAEAVGLVAQENVLTLPEVKSAAMVGIYVALSREVGTDRCRLTSQNHGFAVDAATLPDDWEVWFNNVNDGTVEGIRSRRRPFLAVQFHPEAAPGPRDSADLFDRFVEML